MATASQLHPSTMLLLVAGRLKWWNIFIILSSKIVSLWCGRHAKRHVHSHSYRHIRRHRQHDHLIRIFPPFTASQVNKKEKFMLDEGCHTG